MDRNSYKNKNYRNYRNDQKRSVKKLDMRKNEEFNYMLGTIVRDLPESVRGALRGGIYSIMSKQGTREARDFIVKKKNDGVITEDMEKNLLDLIYAYSKYR
ncbi:MULTISPECIES: hypothetical protein [Acidiplasma]|jgi:hypothetical protein|uniref:Uncharacterized protein n=2 Tax=Acidiplasma TaxID=507753 RepID=A0A0Q0RUF2_9ARCH|nr:MULTISPECIES: hypothetical protein [Acidiplasma]KPV47256.1 hypothetical protein SE19_01820 [Acidiplasma aeolicum]KQB33643.1 hypothetical protein AOG55_02480 [Acidiplasma cupricumulans]KQB34423.1 hypothetical protein AOG54_01190 [Acidiplasma aeolicum]WMT54215.1 MAG: hypothetical protein RE470_04700 [Acidiplasma sp.]